LEINTLYAIRNSDTAQATAASKRVIKINKVFRKINFGQVGAISKSFDFDSLYTIGNGNTFKATATSKSLNTNVSDTIRNNNTSQIVSAVKSRLKDRCDLFSINHRGNNNIRFSTGVAGNHRTSAIVLIGKIGNINFLRHCAASEAYHQHAYEQYGNPGFARISFHTLTLQHIYEQIINPFS